PDDRVELDRLLALRRVLGGFCDDVNRLRGGAVVQLLESDDADRLGAVEAQALPALASGELQGNDAHSDEVGAVDTLKALGDDRLDAEEAGSLCCPVTRRAGAVLLATEDDQR